MTVTKYCHCTSLLWENEQIVVTGEGIYRAAFDVLKNITNLYYAVQEFLDYYQ